MSIYSVTSIALIIFILTFNSMGADFMNLYKFNNNIITRWASFENPNAQKGQGGKTNKGAKGYPFHVMQPGDSVTLLDVKGAGVINRIWMTLDDLFHIPEEMRAVKIKMYWDGCDKPAVDIPIGDFFCAPLGKLVPFENELFASPEGKSFVCYIPMPYKTGAKIVIENGSTNRHHRIFYDVNFSEFKKPEEDVLYFHANWRRENPTTLGKDFVILPKVNGKGKFIGSCIGVKINKNNHGWFGEGEVKIYLDGDKKYPTLCGTGTEDYISTGWGQGKFAQRFHGCLLADEKNGLFSFYRFHIPDPVQFEKDCKVTIQQMGGGPKKEILKMIKKGVKIKPVCAILPNGKQCNFLDGEYKLDDKEFTENIWINYYRQDDFCATAYYYLDKPF